MTLAAATGAVGTSGALFSYSAGYFVKPIETALGWSRGEIAMGSMLAMLTTAATMPVVGLLTDRHGTRSVGLGGIAGYGVLCLVLSILPAHLALYYATLVAIAILLAGTSAVVFAPLVVERFVRRRGMALGILMSGTALLLIPLAPVFHELINGVSWRAGYALLGGLALGVGVPCALLAGRNTPAPAAGAAQVPGMSLNSAVRTTAYWRMVVGVLAATLALGGFLNQLSALVSDKGLTVVEVGMIASLFVTMVLIGRTTVGVLLDLLHPPWVALGMMAAAATGALLLLESEPSLLRCAVATSLLGCAMGAEGDLQAFFTARQFGLRAFSTIFGTLAMCTSAGLGTGALIFGEIYDASGGYDRAIILAAAGLSLSGVLFASLKVGPPPGRLDVTPAPVRTGTV